jgi:hypothetical protein
MDYRYGYKNDMKKIYKYEVCMKYEHQMRNQYNFEGIAQYSDFIP